MFSWNRLHTGVKALFFVQIVNRMGDFVVPFLTLILTQIQGFSPATAGLVVTLASGLGSLGGLLAGKLGDRYSRRNTLVLFMGTSGLLLAGAGFAPEHLAAAVAMVASGFFLGAMRPLLGALVADLSSPETRRAAFSLSYLGINIGVAVGPLLAGWLFQHALNWMFWLDALSTACALTILLRFVPAHTKPTLTEPTTRVPGSSLHGFVHHPILFPYSLLTLAYNFAYAQLIFSQSLQLVELFGTSGPQLFGLVWGVNAITVVALTPLALRLTRSWTNLASMATAMIFITLGISVFLFHPSAAWVLASALCWSVGEVLFSIHAGDLISGQSPPDLRARFQAYSQFLGSLGHGLAPLAGGLIAQTMGLRGVWVLAAILTATAGIGYGTLHRRASRILPR